MALEGKIVWVTGASSGIGKAVAAAFIGKGARVVLSSRDPDRLREIADALGGGAQALGCDVGDEAQVAAATQRIIEEHGGVDILVNNAGASVFKSFMETSVEEFDQLQQTNLRGPFLCTKAVLPGMLARGEGSIVMVNSMAALYVVPDGSAYSASKGGLKALADCLRLEVRKSGVRVISVYPGATNTLIWPERIREKHGEKMMAPEDVAVAVVAACEAPSSVLYEDIVLQPAGGRI